jgi:hypothetical protein
VRGLATLVALGCAGTCVPGCDRVFGLERTFNDAPPPCTLSAFSTPVDLPHFTSSPGREFDPFETVDRLAIWFSRSAIPPSRIYRASRSDVTADYGSDVQVLTSTTGVADPVLTADGQHLLYTDSGAAYQSARVAGTFTAGTRLVLPENVTGIDVSPDGLILYVASGGHLFEARRDTIDSEFHSNQLDLDVPGTVVFPSVYTSGDAIEVFYSVPVTQGSSVHRSYRTTTSQFQDELIITQEGPNADPMISRDGLRLTLAANSSLYQLTRTCDP